MVNILLPKGRTEDIFIDTLISKQVFDEKPDFGRRYDYQKDSLLIYLVRSSDVFQLLADDFGDIAVIGSDVVEEKNDDQYIELLDLNIGECYFVLASTPDFNINNISRIATKYPNIAKKYLNALGMQCEIIKLKGSLELYPNQGYVDGIIDLVETGNTLKANGLIVLEYLERVSTRLITTKENENNEEIQELIKRLK